MKKLLSEEIMEQVNNIFKKGDKFYRLKPLDNVRIGSESNPELEEIKITVVEEEIEDDNEQDKEHESLILAMKRGNSKFSLEADLISAKTEEEKKEIIKRYNEKWH